jgi:hypothetical protein
LIRKLSANGESWLVSDSDVNGEVEVLISGDGGFVRSLLEGDAGDHKSVPLVSDSSIVESTKTRFSMTKYFQYKPNLRERFAKEQFVPILK